MIPGVPARGSISRERGGRLERSTPRDGRPRGAPVERAAAARVLGRRRAASRAEVTLTDFDPDGEAKVVAAALYAVVDAAPTIELLRHRARR